MGPPPLAAVGLRRDGIHRNHAIDATTAPVRRTIQYWLIGLMLYLIFDFWVRWPI
jgi:hypothetical protein